MGNGTPALAPYRIHGWRWHHISLLRDLGLVNEALTEGRMCSPGDSGLESRREVLRAYSHILDENWEIHDRVESTLLYPWINKHSDVGIGRRLLLNILDRKRKILLSKREKLRDSLVKLSLGERKCTPMVHNISSDALGLRSEAAETFLLAERLVIPTVRKLFSEDEQRSFNRTVLRNLSPMQAQISLVVFRDSLYDIPHGGATDKDRRDFEAQVPSPIRALIPLWRKSLLSFRSQILKRRNKTKIIHAT